MVLEQIEVVLGHKHRGGKWEHTFTGEVYKVLFVVLKSKGWGMIPSYSVRFLETDVCVDGRGKIYFYSHTVHGSV